MRSFFVLVLFITAVLVSNRAFAGSTGWLDLSNNRSVNTALRIAEDQMGPGVAYKRVKCKAENGKIMMKVDYNIIGHDGFYGVMTGSKEAIDSHFQQPKEKRLKSRIRSRSDVSTKNGIFSCVIWFRPL